MQQENLREEFPDHFNFRGLFLTLNTALSAKYLIGRRMLSEQIKFKSAAEADILWFFYTTYFAMLLQVNAKKCIYA
jgi:hypothetical protein